VAQLHDALIVATVGTDEKKKFLVDTYGLDPSRIFFSKSTDFLASVMAATSDEGVDIAVNSLNGDLLQTTLKCCAEFGRFVEVGRQDIQDFGKLDMSAFNRNVSVTPFDLAHLFYSKQGRHQRTWQR
jgi:NADPH-dependent curcumin reductase CurA